MVKYMIDTIDKNKIIYFFKKLELEIPETTYINEEGEEVHEVVNPDPTWVQDLFQQWKLKFVVYFLTKVIYKSNKLG